jgi:Ca2+-binding EF-hand superfamily protein
MPRKSARRCSVKKLFKAMDKDGSGSVSLDEVKKAFAKAAGKDQLLTYSEMQKACRKYAGNSKNSKVRSDLNLKSALESCKTNDECRSGRCIKTLCG